MRLHDDPLSADGHKVRLLLSMLGVACERVPVDAYPGREHQSTAFRAIAPMGRLPVLEDADLVLDDAHAILVYLAARYDPKRSWYPCDPSTQGRVAMWLGFAAGELGHILSLRTHAIFGEPLRDIEILQAAAHRALGLLDEHLAERSFEGKDWIAADGPTIADIACFACVALSTDAGLTREAYHQLNRWMYRVRALPGFVTMPGILAR